MSSEAQSKLDLTWIQDGSSRQPGLCFEASESQEGPVTQYTAALQVCEDPRCGCYGIYFCCRQTPSDAGVAPSEIQREFWLDVWDRAVAMTPELEADPITKRFAQSVQARLSDSCWEELYRWFRSAKLEAIQMADLEEVEIDELPEAAGGRMVPFVEVFPQGWALDFPCEGQLWAAEERYCVQLGCKCKETFLSFLQYEDAGARGFVRLSRPPALRYNYKSGASSRKENGAPGTPSPARLLDALKTSHSTLNSQLELRHVILQSLYARQHLARTAAQVDLRLARFAAAARASVKPGRNDPCPCGSGKKFKKCCGA